MRPIRLCATLMLLLFSLAAAAQEKKAEPANHAQASAQKATQQTAPAREPGAAKGGEPEAQRERPGSLAEQLAEESREAAGEEEENAEFKQSSSVRWLAGITGLSPRSVYWLALAVNFLVIAGAIFWFSKSSLPEMFRMRTSAIKKTMQEARQSSENATRRLGEIEARLAKLDREIAALRSSAEAEAAAEEERIRAAAREDARKIAESAGQEIQAAARLAQRELKAYAAELAVSLAEKRIRVDVATDRALVESFASQLGHEARDGGEGA
jgi:F-type H+-transporting ATPase subunit b